LFAISLLFISACGRHGVKLDSKKALTTIEPNLGGLLQGSWFGKDFDEHAVFSIQGDAITYVDDFSTFKYAISKDTFEIVAKEPHYKQIIIILTKDSLVLRDIVSHKISKYWRSN